MNHRQSRLFAIVLISCLTSAIGCGSKHPTVPVSGRVTLDGQPLASVRVEFRPKRSGSEFVSGPDSYGATDANGNFTLKSIDGSEGAVVGSHRVVISAISQHDEDMFEEDVPVDGNRFQAAEVTFDVPASGTDAADFELTLPVDDGGE